MHHYTQLFVVFEIESNATVQGGLKLTIQLKIASNLGRYSCLSLPSARILDMNQPALPSTPGR